MASASCITSGGFATVTLISSHAILVLRNFSLVGSAFEGPGGIFGSRITGPIRFNA